MKNKIKYILLPAMLIIAVIFIATNYGQRLRFGDAWFENDTANKILTNKSLYFESGDSVYYNGVVVTSGTGGGGIAASDNTTFSGYNTFSNGTTFSDSVRANGYSLIDDAKITSYLRVTGEVTTDLNFNKGSSTSIGTISTDSLAFITANTKRIVIDKNGYTVFTDTVQMLDRVYISGNLNVASNIYTTGNVLADSIAGIGRFITEVDAITLKGQDTTHFARTDTLTTERVKSKTEFSDIVTFFLSPIFSAVVNFPYGINVTGTATFNGDMVNNGWTEQGGKIAIDRYYRDTILRAPSMAQGNNITVAHGISNINRVVLLSAVIKDDSSGILVPCSGSSGFVLYAQTPWMDATNVYLRITGNQLNLDDNTDTVKFYIRYTDYQR